MIRVSRIGSRDETTFISPTVQRRRIEEVVRTHGHEVVEWVEELDVSARRPRAQVERIVSEVESGRVDGIVVMRQDRLARSAREWADTVDRVYAAGGLLVSADEGYDLSTKDGRLMGGVGAAIAQHQSDRATEDFAEGCKAAIGRGVHWSPVPPFGYRHVRVRGKLQPLEVAEDQRSHVEELFARAAAGESFSSLARWLTDSPMITAYGNPGWTPRAVRDVVRNRRYLGVAVHGEFENAEAHPALVSQAVFDAAQRPGRAVAGRGGRPNLLRGLVRCAGCGYGVMSDHLDDKRRYRCHTRHSAGRCPTPAQVVGPELEQLVVERFFDSLDDRIFRATSVDADRRRLVEQRDDRRRQLDVFIEDVDDGAISPAVWRKRCAALEVALEESEAALRAASSDTGEQLTTIKEQWPHLSVDERSYLLAGAYDCVFIRRRRSRTESLTDRVLLCAAGEMPEWVPRRGGRRSNGPIRSVPWPGDE